MIVATTPFIAGHRVAETKGQVFGLVVRSRGLAGNLIAGLRSLGGGEIHEYTELLEDTRRQALDRLVQNATLMGANAVISMRFDSSEMAGTMSEIVAYGTAVVVVPDAGDAADRRVAPGALRGCPRRSSVVLAGAHRCVGGRRARSASAPGGRARPVSPLFVRAASARGRRPRADRYRSADGRADGRGARARAAASRSRLEPRFRPTEERFVDPTTGVPMRSGSTRRPASGGTCAEG